MRIAPIDIAHKTFHRKMMGFDPEEVMEFLRLVSEELEIAVRERNGLKENLREKEISIAEYRERDELLKSTITTATRMSEKLHADAERESRLIINDANQKAEVIVREARDSLKRIYTEISELKKNPHAVRKQRARGGAVAPDHVGPGPAHHAKPRDRTAHHRRDSRERSEPDAARPHRPGHPEESLGHISAGASFASGQLITTPGISSAGMWHYLCSRFCSVSFRSLFKFSC